MPVLHQEDVRVLSDKHAAGEIVQLRGSCSRSNAVATRQQYQNTLHQMTNYFLAQGSLLPEAQQQAVNWIGQQVQAQSSFLAYMDVFWVLTLLSLAAVPLALSLRKVKLGGAAPAAH